jgi:predicted metal-binding protein
VKRKLGKNIDTEKIRQIVTAAVEKGAYRAKAFSARLVAVDERVRLKCQIPLCPHFGTTLTCPPNIPTVEEFSRALRRYRKAVLVQMRSPITMKMEQVDREEALRFFERGGRTEQEKGGKKTEAAKNFDDMKLAALRLHKLVNEVEGMAMCLGFPYALGLIGGECKLCSSCIGPGGACRRPYQARPSMEGVGIDVIQTSIRAGLPFAIPPVGEIIWSGLVLID